MWTKLAFSQHDAETESWIRDVARRMLEADREDLKQRPGAVLLASGLRGRDSRSRQSELFGLFCYVEGVKNGIISEPVHDYMGRLFGKEESTETLKAWIRRLVDDLPPEKRHEYEPYLKGRREI